MGRPPLHPPLLAAFPALFLWAENAQEAEPAEALPVVGASLAAGGLLAVLLGLALRSQRRGALVASAAAVVVLGHGRLLGDALPATAGLAVAAAAVVAAALLARRLGEARLASVTSTLDIGAVLLVLAAILPVAGGLAAAEPAAELPATVADAPGATARERPPDIYYIVPDRYPRQDTLAEVFDHDNTAFLARLEALGFDVLERSVANYPKTAHSLAASLNLGYLDELAASVPAGDQASWRPVYGLLRDHALGRVLTDLGYEYHHLGTWWSPTQTAASADVTLNHDRASEFRRVFADTTLWRPLRELSEGGTVDQRRWKYDHTAYQLDQLDRLAREEHDRPRFVFAHLTIPHEPYVFDRDGSFVTAGEEAARTREDNLVRQVDYANRRLARLLGELISGDPSRDPIVVLQSDEGPHPAARVAQGPPFRWDLADDADLREKLRILNAVHLPGRIGALPESATPVNTFRLVLSEYFGADLAPLDDRAYVFPDESRLYDYTEVTDRVR